MRYCSFLVLSLALCTSEVACALVNAQPQLRISANMHTSKIEQIRYSHNNNRVVSIGSDKTIRVWQLPKLKLIRTIYVPSDNGNEGLLFGLTISPDGKTIAVGGWTGVDWHKKASIYFFDIDSGKMLKRLADLPNIVDSLAYSSDGKYLAVGLSGQDGLQMYDTKTWKVRWSDKEYGDQVIFVDVSKDGLVATTAADGYVRLYNQEGKLTLRQNINISKRLGGIRFSPDGLKVAFGVIDQPLAGVIAADGSKILAIHRINNIDQKSLCCIAWSKDNQYLYLNGKYQGSGQSPLYRYDQQGLSNTPVKLEVGQRQYTNMLPLPDGSLVFSTNTPSFGLLDPQGRLIREVNSPILHQDNLPNFKLSNNGQVISFFNQVGEQQIFDIFNGQWLIEPKVKLSSAIKQKANWSFRQQDNQFPLVNNKAINALPFEEFTSYCFSKVKNKIFVGSNWHIRAFDSKGTELWKKSIQSGIEQVNESEDGKWLVIALADGTFRWLNTDTGDEVLGLYVHPESKEWVVWRADGRYASSIYGDQHVGWLLNQGDEKTPLFIKAVQLERSMYQPLAIKEAFNEFQPKKLILDGFLSDLPPVVNVVNAELKKRGVINLDLEIDVGHKSNIDSVIVYVNGIPYTPTAERKINNINDKFLKRMQLQVSEQELDIRVEAISDKGIGVSEYYLEHNAPNNQQKGKLYLVSIGVNQFDNLSSSNLRFAINDSVAFANILQKQSPKFYQEVVPILINNDALLKPTRQNIMEQLKKLEQAKADDTVIIYLASHGFKSNNGDYYFLTSDADLNETKDALNSKITINQVKTLLPWQDILSALWRVAGKRILVIDTCHAQQITEKLDPFSLLKRSASSNIAVLAAAKGDELSQELAHLGHGVFTYSLIDAISKKDTDTNQDGLIQLQELFQRTAENVNQLRIKNKAQTPQFIGDQSSYQYPISIPID